jgi:hypothetical protein
MTEETPQRVVTLGEHVTDPDLHESWFKAMQVPVQEVRFDRTDGGPARLRLLFHPMVATWLRQPTTAALRMTRGHLVLQLDYVTFTAGRAIFEVRSAQVLPPEAPAPQDAALLIEALSPEECATL